MPPHCCSRGTRAARRRKRSHRTPLVLGPPRGPRIVAKAIAGGGIIDVWKALVPAARTSVAAATRCWRRGEARFVIGWASSKDFHGHLRHQAIVHLVEVRHVVLAQHLAVLASHDLVNLDGHSTVGAGGY